MRVILSNWFSFIFLFSFVCGLIDKGQNKNTQ